MRKVLHVLLFVLACILPVSACSKSNPVAPSPVGGGGTQAVQGELVIEFERELAAHEAFLAGPPTGVHSPCVPTGNAHYPRLFSAPGGWPGGYEIRASPDARNGGVDMSPVSPRVFRYVVKDAPAGGGLAITAFDPCLGRNTGAGFTVNGVRLRDESYWAHFDFRPNTSPSIVVR